MGRPRPGRARAAGGASGHTRRAGPGHRGAQGMREGGMVEDNNAKPPLSSRAVTSADLKPMNIRPARATIPLAGTIPERSFVTRELGALIPRLTPPGLPPALAGIGADPGRLAEPRRPGPGRAGRAGAAVQRHADAGLHRPRRDGAGHDGADADRAAERTARPRRGAQARLRAARPAPGRARAAPSRRPGPVPPEARRRWPPCRRASCRRRWPGWRGASSPSAETTCRGGITLRWTARPPCAKCSSSQEAQPCPSPAAHSPR
jgi:hypothetical protein